MRLVNYSCLARGKILIDCILREPEVSPSLEVADMIGIVAAYIAKGLVPCEIEKILSPYVGQELARRAWLTFELFNDENRDGLWSQGPAIDDVAFTDRKLQQFYPHVPTENGSVPSRALG